MLKYLTFFLLFFSLTQCTVQKRLYNKGYSVSWNRKFRNADVEKENEQLTDETDESVAGVDTLVNESLSAQDAALQDGLLPVDEDQSVLEENTSKAPLADTVYIVSKNVPEGVAAACLLAGSIIGSRVAVLLTTYVGYALIACAAMFLASFILAIASIVIYKRYRKDYLTNILGKLTFIIDVVAIVVFATLILLAIFLY